MKPLKILFLFSLLQSLSMIEVCGQEQVCRQVGEMLIHYSETGDTVRSIGIPFMKPETIDTTNSRFIGIFETKFEGVNIYFDSEKQLFLVSVVDGNNSEYFLINTKDGKLIRHELNQPKKKD